MDNQSMRRTHLHSWRWRMRTLLMYFNNRLGVVGAAKRWTADLESINSHILFDPFPPNALSTLLFFFFLFVFVSLNPPHPFPVLNWVGRGLFSAYVRGQFFKLKPCLAWSDCHCVCYSYRVSGHYNATSFRMKSYLEVRTRGAEEIRLL
ncbi:hypothetical protein COCON_G00048660 [Conger conger]|uniref:Uncharacterized protein n=1 Tax=Conger conger TaxID=82655 RepID=A0A9Q1DV23_CONCO|nr:hypothetical protein COCON_G00048660 [Conger conger]